MTITTVFYPPLPSDSPATFSAKAFALFGTLNTWSAEANALPAIDPGVGFKSSIINGNFQINQRAVSGTVTLAAGAYGHDRWKAGASGCTYTFSTSANVTTLTISAGSLIQVVEGENLFTGTYCLSWSGTATGKIGAGSYSVAGITGSVTGGTNTSLEFSTGTLSKVIFEPGTIAGAFEARPIGVELAMCQRYYYRTTPGMSKPVAIAYPGGTTSDTACVTQFPVPMRIAPTAVESSGSSGQYQGRYSGSTTAISASPTFHSYTTTTEGWSSFTIFHSGNIWRVETVSAAAYLGWSAEL